MLYVTIYNNGVVTSISLLSETRPVYSDVMLNVNEVAYRLLLQTGDRTWPLRGTLTTLELLHLSKSGNSYNNSSAVGKVVFTISNFGHLH